MFPIFFVNGFLVGASTTYILTHSYMEYKYVLIRRDKIPYNYKSFMTIYENLSKENPK
jgi:hypothetical protein